MYYPLREEKNLELPDLEIFAFIASVFLTLKGWWTWYGDIASVNRLRAPVSKRLVLLTAPLVCLALTLIALTKLAATAVRNDALYISFYLLVGAGWLGGVTLIFPFLGISARDDVLERGNRAASWAVTGALTGASCSFAGANVGNGPGVEAVLFSAVLSSALFIGLWLGMDLLTSISDAITVDRDERAGIRLGGLLLGIGLLSGWWLVTGFPLLRLSKTLRRLHGRRYCLRGSRSSRKWFSVRHRCTFPQRQLRPW